MPHGGADIADWSAVLGRVGSVVGLRNTNVIKELKRWSYTLVDLANAFGELAPDFEITTYFEKIPLRGVLVSKRREKLDYNIDSRCDQVVPEGSARLNTRGERCRGLDANHSSICKFTEKDGNWPAVSARLGAIMEGIAPLAEGVPQVPEVDGLQERFKALKSPGS